MKINKTICIEETIFEKLKQETNASQLIERLLNNYYSDRIIEEIKEQQDFSGKKAELEKEIAEITEKERVVKERAELISEVEAASGINNPELILKLEKMTYPNIMTAKELRDKYVVLGGVSSIWKAWDILHKSEDNKV